MARSFFTTRVSYRSAGWSAITSGILGLLAFAALITAVLTRTSWEITPRIWFLFNVHNAVTILQFLSMIPLAIGLYNLSHKQSPGMSRATLNIGIVTLSLTALFNLLYFPKIMSDEYYMIPQGVFGVWLIAVNWQLKSILSKGLRWFGIIVGFGLALVGVYEIGFAIFVDPSGLRIPAPDFESIKDPGDTTANIIVHLILDIGTFIGVLPFPIWAITIGRKLLREKEEQLLTKNLT